MCTCTCTCTGTYMYMQCGLQCYSVYVCVSQMVCQRLIMRNLAITDCPSLCTLNHCWSELCTALCYSYTCMNAHTHTHTHTLTLTLTLTNTHSHCAAEDCYHLGRDAYNSEDFQYTRDWMKETLRFMNYSCSKNTNIQCIADMLLVALVMNLTNWLNIMCSVCKIPVRAQRLV